MGFGTVSLLSSPDRFSPVYTDGLWFQLYNASYSQYEGFQYNVKSYAIDVLDNTVIGLGTYSIPPRPDNGYGIFTPHKLIGPLIDNRITSNIGLTGVSPLQNSLYQYYIEYGFVVNSLGFTYGVISQSGLNNINLKTSYASFFNQGDEVYISKNTYGLNSTYNGIATVLTVTASGIEINKTYTGTPDYTFGSPDGGYITSVSRYNANTYALPSGTGSKYCWNATRQYSEKNYDFGPRYVFSGISNGITLTDYDRDTDYAQTPYNMKPIRLDQYETVSFIADGYTSEINQIYLGVYNTAGTLLGAYISQISATISSIAKFDVGVGPMNLKSLFNNNTIFNGASFYAIFIGYKFNTPSMTIGGYLYRKIDDTCTMYDVVQLRFLNRLGGYECYNFIRNNKKTLNITRTEWRSELPFNYTIGDRQQNVLSQVNNMTYEVNTDWVTEYDYNFLQEIITSPEVYRISGTNSIPIVILDKNWVQKKKVTEQVFNLTIKFKDAFFVRTQDN